MTQRRHYVVDDPEPQLGIERLGSLGTEIDLVNPLLRQVLQHGIGEQGAGSCGLPRLHHHSADIGVSPIVCGVDRPGHTSLQFTILIMQHQDKGRPDFGILLVDRFDVEDFACWLRTAMRSEDCSVIRACGHMNGFVQITALSERGIELLIRGEYHHLIDEVALLPLFIDQLIQIIERSTEKAGLWVVDDDVGVEAKLLLTQLQQGKSANCFSLSSSAVQFSG